MTSEAQARAVLRGLWPGWDGALSPLGGLAFRVAEAPVPAVIKLWPQELAEKALRQVARQRVVAAGLAHGPFRAPKVLHFDPAELALVMQDCCGQPLEAALERAPDPQAETIVVRAGGWIAAHHALTLREAPFRPIGHLRWLDKLAGMGASGEREIADIDRFRHEVAGMHALFDEVRRRPTIKAVIHKDMNAGNLLVTEGAIWGVDFENDTEDEPLRDLFALGVELCAFAPFGQDRRRALDTLTRGYGPARGDALVRLFLQRAFALGLWARTPSTASYRQQARQVVADWILTQPEAVI